MVPSPRAPADSLSASVSRWGVWRLLDSGNVRTWVLASFFNQKDWNSDLQFTYTKCSCLGYETAATEVAKYIVQGPEPRLSFPRYANKCGDCTLYCANPSRPSPVKEKILVSVSFQINGGSSTIFLHLTMCSLQRFADQTCRYPPPLLQHRKRVKGRRPSLGRRTLKIPTTSIFRQLSGEEIPSEPRHE